MSDTTYCYPPDYTVLRNKFGIRNAAELDRLESRRVALRFDEGVPTGNFDLDHLKTIHHHLFQDVYEWAGQIRTVEISKGGSQFQYSRYIETGMRDVHRRLVEGHFLKGLSGDEFARQAGQIIGDINYVHPFRDGNGRTQLLYLEQLATRAGHTIDLKSLDRAGWVEACRNAHGAEYGLLAKEIRHAMTGLADDYRRAEERERGRSGEGPERDGGGIRRGPKRGRRSR